MTELVRLRTIWKRNAGLKTGASGRRRVNDLTRSRIQWYRDIHGDMTLPVATAYASSDDDWSDAEPEAVKIVVFPLGVGKAPIPIAQMRKGLRRSLFKSLDITDGGHFEMLSSRYRGDTRPTIGEGHAGGRIVTRGLMLEELGAVIMPSLSDTEIEALEGEGAVVLDNDVVTIDEPQAGQPSGTADPHWHLFDVNVNAARAKGLKGAGTLIGVLDTGIDDTHSEFAGKTVYYQAFETDGSKSSQKAARDYGTHGTHVSALCAGATVGVAPLAHLAVAAVLTQKNAKGQLCGYRAQILAGINWLAQGTDGLPRSVDIINASLGSSDSDAYYYIPLSGHRLVGLLMIAAIGNKGTAGIGNHCSPGKYDCVIGVGAADEKGAVAAFSAWGPTYVQPGTSQDHKPDLLAPGVHVRSALPKGKYGFMNGTSMACPIVSGAAALMIEQDRSLRANPTMLASKICSMTRAVPSGSSNSPHKVGHGLLDLTNI